MKLALSDVAPCLHCAGVHSSSSTVKQVAPATTATWLMKSCLTPLHTAHQQHILQGLGTLSRIAVHCCSMLPWLCIQEEKFACNARQHMPSMKTHLGRIISQVQSYPPGSKHAPASAGDVPLLGVPGQPLPAIYILPVSTSDTLPDTTSMCVHNA